METPTIITIAIITLLVSISLLTRSGGDSRRSVSDDGAGGDWIWLFGPSGNPDFSNHQTPPDGSPHDHGHPHHDGGGSHHGGFDGGGHH